MNESLLIQQISFAIENKRLEFLKQTNSSLIALFWRVGNKLNAHFNGSKQIRNYGSNISVVSSRLTTMYGLSFTEDSISKMRHFAEQFPDVNNVGLLASFLSWEHFSILSQMKDPDTKLFYIQLSLEQKLKPIDLIKKIDEGAFERQKTKDRKKSTTLKNGYKTKTYDPDYLRLAKIGAENDTFLENLFEGSNLSSLQYLLEPLKKSSWSSIGDDLSALLINEIEEYKTEQNRWLNSRLNEFFWEIGEQINKANHLFENETNREQIIEKVGLELEKSNGEIFSIQEIEKMADFARQVPRRSNAALICSETTWEYISALATVKDINTKLFYIELAMKNNLSPLEMKEQIKNTTFKQEFEEGKQNQNSTSRIKIQISSGENNAVNSVLIASNSSHRKRFAPEILKNHTFLTFIGSVRRPFPDSFRSDL